MVTHQLQVKHRTGKVHWPETNVIAVLHSHLMHTDAKLSHVYVFIICTMLSAVEVELGCVVHLCEYALSVSSVLCSLYRNVVM